MRDVMAAMHTTFPHSIVWHSYRAYSYAGMDVNVFEFLKCKRRKGHDEEWKQAERENLAAPYKLEEAVHSVYLIGGGHISSPWCVFLPKSPLSPSPQTRFSMIPWASCWARSNESELTFKSRDGLWIHTHNTAASHIPLELSADKSLANKLKTKSQCLIRHLKYTSKIHTAAHWESLASRVIHLILQSLWAFPSTENQNRLSFKPIFSYGLYCTLIHYSANGRSLWLLFVLVCHVCPPFSLITIQDFFYFLTKVS